MKKRSFLEPANIIFIIAILVAIWFLARMRQENTWLRSQIKAPPDTLVGPPEAQPGDIVPPFYSVNIDSQPVKFDRGPRRLLYIFSPNCGQCFSQFAAWNQLAATAKSKQLVVHGLSIDGLAESKSNLERVQRDFDIAIMPNIAIKRAYRVVAIPEVLLVSGEGTVEWVHYGALTEEKIKELFSLIQNIPPANSD